VYELATGQRKRREEKRREEKRREEKRREEKRKENGVRDGRIECRIKEIRTEDRIKRIVEGEIDGERERRRGREEYLVYKGSISCNKSFSSVLTAVVRKPSFSAFSTNSIWASVNCVAGFSILLMI
jgi:hypothetical protein